MKIKKKNKIRIFERVYDKCARLEPGQSIELAPVEKEVLDLFLHRDWMRKLMGRERNRRNR